MDPQQLEQLLERVRGGHTDVHSAMRELRHLPFEDLGFAKVDHHRAMRHGMPEVILGQGKTADQVAGIASALLAKSRNLLVTRGTQDMADQIGEFAPEVEYFPGSGVIRV